ncbi:MAG: hypothetical protein AB7R55_16785 [Gemmatimonadales bacterium]
MLANGTSVLAGLGAGAVVAILWAARRFRRLGDRVQTLRIEKDAAAAALADTRQAIDRLDGLVSVDRSGRYRVASSGAGRLLGGGLAGC